MRANTEQVSAPDRSKTSRIPSPPVLGDTTWGPDFDETLDGGRLRDQYQTLALTTQRFFRFLNRSSNPLINRERPQLFVVPQTDGNQCNAPQSGNRHLHLVLVQHS